MLPLLPAYRASNFVDTIQTDDVPTGGANTTLRPRQWRGRRHRMPTLDGDGERDRHIVVCSRNLHGSFGDRIILFTRGYTGNKPLVTTYIFSRANS